MTETTQSFIRWNSKETRTVHDALTMAEAIIAPLVPRMARTPGNPAFWAPFSLVGEGLKN